MTSIRIGIIGFGNMGSAHAKCIEEGKIIGMTLGAICDTAPGQREQARRRHPLTPVYESAGALLQSGSCDAVLIATPHYFHPPIACEAFRMGQHVLTEKPAGVEASQVRKMIGAARSSGKAFGIMFNQRTNPLFRRAREIVQSGRLGKRKRLVWIITNWYRTQSYYDSGSWRATWAGEGGGVLLNQAPHNLDLWQWIFGMPVRLRSCCTVGKYHRIEVEDDAAIYAEYEDGASAAFLTSTGEYPGTNRLEISGDLGKLVLEEGKLKWWRLTEPERSFCYTAQEGFYQPDVQYEERIPEEPETAHAGILQNFANHILFGEELIAPGEEGLNELSLSNAAYLSSWTDGWVPVPCSEADFEEQLRRRAVGSVSHGAGGKALSGDGYSSRWQVNW